MSKITFLVLLHYELEKAHRLIETLSNKDVTFAIHVDKKVASEEYESFKKSISRMGIEAAFVEDRINCGWGDFSLVQATCNLIFLANKKFSSSTHYYLISGSDYLLRPIGELLDFLEEYRNTDFIEAFDMNFPQKWKKTWLLFDRFKYFYFFSLITARNLFILSFKIQKILKISRPFPKGINPRLGSQWWCLTSSTALKAAKFIQKNKFSFKYTWVPDEFAFQSIVPSISDDWKSVSLSFYQFDYRGVPIVLYNDHCEIIEKIPHFFVRKLSPDAEILRDFIDKSRDQNIKNIDIDNFQNFSLKYNSCQKIHELLISNRRQMLFFKRNPGNDDLSINPMSFDIEIIDRPFVVFVVETSELENYVVNYLKDAKIPISFISGNVYKAGPKKHINKFDLFYSAFFNIVANAKEHPIAIFSLDSNFSLTKIEKIISQKMATVIFSQKQIKSKSFQTSKMNIYKNQSISHLVAVARNNASQVEFCEERDLISVINRILSIGLPGNIEVD